MVAGITEAELGSREGDETAAERTALPEHRKKASTAKLWNGILDAAKEEAFAAVYSRHVPGINAVFVPKLKAGFVLSGREALEAFGTLARMTYYYSGLRRECDDFRVGLKKPTQRIKDQVGL